MGPTRSHHIYIWLSLYQNIRIQERYECILIYTNVYENTFTNKNTPIFSYPVRTFQLLWVLPSLISLCKISRKIKIKVIWIRPFLFIFVLLSFSTKFFGMPKRGWSFSMGLTRVCRRDPRNTHPRNASRRFLHICLYTWVHTYMHTYKHTYINRCIHASMHAYKHKKTYMHARKITTIHT